MVVSKVSSFIRVLHKPVIAFQVSISLINFFEASVLWGQISCVTKISWNSYGFWTIKCTQVQNTAVFSTIRTQFKYFLLFINSFLRLRSKIYPEVLLELELRPWTHPDTSLETLSSPGEREPSEPGTPENIFFNIIIIIHDVCLKLWF